MFAVRESGFDANGNYYIEPNWAQVGHRVGLSAEEIVTIDDTGAPLATLLFHIQAIVPIFDNPVIKDPTKAANAKASTLQSRVDGLMDADGQFHPGEIQISVDKDTQDFSIVALPLTILARPPLDADFDKTYAAVNDAQMQYIGTHKRYAQVLPDGTSPDYQPDPLPYALPAGYEVHQYESPRGNGWILLRDVAIKGTRFRKMKQFGPDDFYAAEWGQG